MAFRNFLSSLIAMPVVRADDEEELVDPQTTLREQCQSKGNIEALYNKYQACNDRVNSRSKTTETCMEELFDYVTELDHCVAHSLFSKLK
ncbi:cytochrome b-c1 complex subunit 6, mitochondrial [Lucilia sericata]|uniref:cytochrome b-c1 complex subunit 6, mitochondrial n=1 Tax=Lucilia sericata TaxID=13632 RepID=UPI0018A87B75|nr:cytochrome b-c1 complex subunit 6, mitochondrial [Lucilia sericata]XP_037823710.1 cytochrome b-c1 complex subunit 6, mitochondrial [Lucilia sericata]